MRAVMIQPGGYGDILLCAPIAKSYADKGYDVYWPAREKFKDLITAFDYVEYIRLSEQVLDPDWLRSDVLKILSMSKAFDIHINLADRGPHRTAQHQHENFEECKYRLASVDFKEKHNLKWHSDIEKELNLFNRVAYDSPYAFVHVEDSLGGAAILPDINLPIVKSAVIDGYSILDWYLVIKHAAEIYCVESAFHQFIDGITDKVTDRKFLLKRPILKDNTRFTVSNNWKLDYIGHGSIVVG